MAVDSGTYDQATIARRQKIAEAMLGDSMKPRKIEHWAQGLAQLGQAGVGGYLSHQANEESKAAKAGDMAALAALLGGGGAAAQPPAPEAPSSPPPISGAPVASAMASPVGPVTPPIDGARAEVMPSNKVWGDKEAEAAGLYEPTPYKVAGPPVAAPQAPVAQAMAQPQMPQTGGGLLAGATPQQRAAILAGMNAGESSPARAIAMSMMSNLTKGDAPTDETKEYKLAQSQGYKGTFMDFKTALKKAGATNVTTNVDKGEDAFAKASGTAQAKRFDELAGEGQKAKQMVADIDTLTELGKSIGTGKSAEILAKVGPWAESIGVPVKGLSDIQAFEALVNRVAPNMRVPGAGAQSDFELKNFLKSLPALGNTPEGNALAAATMKGLQENKILAAEISSKALNGEITRPQAEKMLRELPDPMENYRAYTKASKPAAGSSGEGWQDLGGGVRIREKK